MLRKQAGLPLNQLPMDGHGDAHDAIDIGDDEDEEKGEKQSQRDGHGHTRISAASPTFQFAFSKGNQQQQRVRRDESSAYDTKGKKQQQLKEEFPSAAFCTPLVAPPTFPNSVKWSEDNLIAVATSQLITILNPASIEGPRGFLTASSQPQFSIGRIEAPGLDAPCLLPICFSRDVRAVVRSMDWSPQGLAPNGGCLLAVCTKDHRVKLYRAPFCEFQSEWVEVLDLSEVLYNYNCQNRFMNLDQTTLEGHIEETVEVDGSSPSGNWHAKGKRSHRSSKEPQHRKAQKSRDESLQGLDAGGGVFSVLPRILDETQNVSAGITKTTQPDGKLNVENATCPEESRDSLRQNGKAAALVPFAEEKVASSDATSAMALEHRSSLISQVSTEVEPTLLMDRQTFNESVQELVKIDMDNWPNSCIAPSTYLFRTNMLAYVVVAWSSTLKLECLREDLPKTKSTNMVLIAVGAKSGEVSVLRAIYPQEYTIEKANSVPEVSLVGIFQAHNSWVTAICWGKEYNAMHDKDGIATGYEVVFLATGSCDGSVSVWAGDAGDFKSMPSNSGSVPLYLIRKVLSEDSIPVTSISVQSSPHSSKRVQVAVGKASGGLLAMELDSSGKSCREAYRLEAHALMITGVVWALNGRCLYTCGQDNVLCAWTFSGRELVALPFPQGSALVDSESSDPLSGLPNSVLDGFFGLDLSKGSLALATLRGVSAEMLDPMYQSRSIKAAAQVFWVGGQHSVVQSMHVSVLLQNMSCQIPGVNLAQWDFNLQSALQHFENSSVKLVLWDVVACLMSLKTVVGRRFLNVVVTKWFLRLGLAITESQEDDFVMFRESNRQDLSNVSSRCLHIISVIARRLYLSGANPSIDTEKTTPSESPSCTDQPASVSNLVEKAWQRLLLDVQHELRQRLIHLTLRSVACSVWPGRESGNTYQVPDSVRVSCMLKWVLANSSKVSSHLLTVAQNIGQGLKGYPQTEVCSFCNGKVPFESAENGHCQASQGHKLLRCMFTLEILPLSSLWFCNCCARWASKLAPGSFFSLCTGHDIQLSKESLVSHDNSVPYCPFCGILMQRLLPDCFLRLHLV